MSYLPASFPIKFAARPVGGPGFSTRLVAVGSGHEQRNQNWSTARWSGDASIGIRSERDFELVRAHFRMARGRLHKFRLKDYAEFKCARADGFLERLTDTTFQLHKRYGDEPGFEDYRKITRPVSATLQIWDNDVLLTSGYTLAAETGIVTFSVAPAGSPPGGALECAFQFDVPVRYDTDQLQAVLVRPEAGDREAYHAWESIPLVEVRE